MSKNVDFELRRLAIKNFMPDNYDAVSYDVDTDPVKVCYGSGYSSCAIKCQESLEYAHRQVALSGQFVRETDSKFKSLNSHGAESLLFVEKQTTPSFIGGRYFVYLHAKNNEGRELLRVGRIQRLMIDYKHHNLSFVEASELFDVLKKFKQSNLPSTIEVLIDVLKSPKLSHIWSNFSHMYEHNEMNNFVDNYYLKTGCCNCNDLSTVKNMLESMNYKFG